MNIPASISVPPDLLEEIIRRDLDIEVEEVGATLESQFVDCRNGSITIIGPYPPESATVKVLDRRKRCGQLEYAKPGNNAIVAAIRLAMSKLAGGGR